MISKTKLDSSFTEAEFYMESYQNGILARSENGGRYHAICRGEIPSKIIQPVCRKLDKEHFLVQINLRKKMVACWSLKSP